MSPAALPKIRGWLHNMNGARGGTQRNAEQRWTSQSLRLPRLEILELEATEQRKLHLWGKSLIGSVEAWEHRKMRRREGPGGGVR